MKQYDSRSIKNIALAGHNSAGKTTLAEAMLFLANASDRLGKVADSNTIMDFDPEEKKRKVSIYSSVASFEYRDTKFNIIDSPGLFDFAAGMSEAVKAAETVVIVLSSKSGLNVGSEKAFKLASAQKKKKAFFISKADSEHADCFKVINQLKDTYGNAICPITIPYVVNNKVEAYVDLITRKAFKYENNKAVEIPMPDLGGVFESMHSIMSEAVATADDSLMEKFFEGEEFTPEEVAFGLNKGVASGDIVPVFCGAGLSCQGVDLFLYTASKIFPSANEAVPEQAVNEANEVVEIKVDSASPLSALVFKSIADPFVGKLSFIKVITGKIESNSSVFNARTQEPERIGKLLCICGGKQIECTSIGAGDIGAVAKLSNVVTGDTLCANTNKVKFNSIDFPKPCISMAIAPAKKGEEDKIAAAMNRIMEEDPTISYYNNKETFQQIISGLGEQHLDIVVSKLKNKFGVDVLLSPPKVAYRETIRKKVKVQGRHKKQSGGHGQFGDVWIEFEPCEGQDLLFEEKVFGGAVPKNFFPAVEKGLRDSIKKGVLASYPVVGLKATLVDGSYHPVDSSEMSFKLAAAAAYKNGLPQANPVLLEPIGTLKAVMPDANMGDIIGDINKRRGRVLGMNPLEDKTQEIVAEVPIAEMSDFSTVLRSITQGRGSFSLDFERYEDVPPNISVKIIEQAKKEQSE